MREFSFQVDAADKESYCYVYCIESLNGRLLTWFPSYAGMNSFPAFKNRDEEAEGEFESYVGEHLIDILCGNDVHAEIKALIVEFDFSLTISVGATETESTFDHDHYIDYEVIASAGGTTDFKLMVSDEDNVIIEYYYIDLKKDGELLIWEHYSDASSDPSRWQNKTLLDFRRGNYPKIGITKYY